MFIDLQWKHVIWKMPAASDSLCLLPTRMCLVRIQKGRRENTCVSIIVHFMWEDVEQHGRIMGVSDYYQVLLVWKLHWATAWLELKFWCQVVIQLYSLLLLWLLTVRMLSVFAHVIMVCQCEHILCSEMGLLKANHGDRRDGLGNRWNQMIIQF